MLYPRIDSEGRLVTDDQMVSHREHLAMEHRMLFLSGQITEDLEACNLLMAFDSVSYDPIKLVIASGGGVMESALIFYDTIKLMASPVYTLGRYCVSAASLLLAVGTKRYLLPHARVMLHLPYIVGLSGDVRDIGIQQKEMERYKDTLIELYQECGVKKSKSKLLADIDREKWMGAEEAIAYGLADVIATPQLMEDWLGKKDG